MAEPLEQSIEAAAKAIQQADAIIIGAGAGIGVDSGMPDFRGDQGFWKAYPVFQQRRLSFADMANPRWFREDPQQAWGFYGHRYNMYQQTEPHAGFSILKQWVDQKPLGGFVFTSNVDGHFQKAGFSEEAVYECHGSINYLQCVEQCSESLAVMDIWPANFAAIDIDQTELRATGSLPQCPSCGGLARPNILMFGDGEWLEQRSSEQWRRLNGWRRGLEGVGIEGDGLEGSKVAVIEIGAGTAIPSVRYFCESIGGQLIRINPRESFGPKGTISISLRALEALEEIDRVEK